MKKISNILLIIQLIIFGLIIIPQKIECRQLSYHSICENDNVRCCKNVGKDAYNISFNTDCLLGRIIGVTWKLKGSVIAIDDAIPSVGILENIRLSPRSAYYYIIDGGVEGGVGQEGYIFIRQCYEINPK